MVKGTSKSEIGEQLGYLGLLVTGWNELEVRVRSLLLRLAPDYFTAGFIVADFQIGPLINTTRLLARELEWMHDRINARLRRNKRVRTKLFHPILHHVEFFLEAVDILREHRNYYVHNALFEGKNRRALSIFKISAKSRYSMHADVMDTKKILKLIYQLNEFAIYAEKLRNAIEKNESVKFSERPTWPKRPPLPERLKMHRVTLQDAVLPLRSLKELSESRVLQRIRDLSAKKATDRA